MNVNEYKYNSHTEMSDELTSGVKDLLFKMADDELILGHRNSEWTGLGPILEEDIAFSSMAQDKLGQAQAIYNLLNQMGEQDADTLAFTRNENEYKCCHFVEYPIGEYDFSLMRHFLFDAAEALRYNSLLNSSYKPLSDLAKKFRGELRYHTLHSEVWIEQLSRATEESKARMQSALNECKPLALGIFEPSKYDDLLLQEGVFTGEENLKSGWYEHIQNILTNSGLKVPDLSSITPSFGGRNGYHTEYLKPLLDEMCEVYKIDPEAEW